MDKLTNTKALDYVLEHCELPDDVREKVENIKTSYAKKRSDSGKPTPTQEANNALADRIYEAMEENVEYTASDIIANVEEAHGLNTQKVAPVMKILVATGRAVKTEGRKTTYRKI